MINLFDSCYQVLISNQIRLLDDVNHIKRTFYQKHFDKFKIIYAEKTDGSFAMKYSVK